MKRIKLNAGEYLALERNTLIHSGVPEYKVEYIAVPSENIGVALCRSKDGRQDYHWLDVLWCVSMGNDGEKALEDVIKEQNRIEQLLLNKGVDEVICLFWNDIFTFAYNKEWRGTTWSLVLSFYDRSKQ